MSKLDLSQYQHVSDLAEDKSSLKKYTLDEVAKHNTEESLWIVLDGTVFDLTDFIDMHPGGRAVLLDDDIAGKDATETFFGLHRSSVLRSNTDLIIGLVEDYEEEVLLPTPGKISPIPYAEPAWLIPGLYSPYYDETHYLMAMWIREMVDSKFYQIAIDCEKNDERPPIEMVKECGRLDINRMRMGPTWLLNGRTYLDGRLKGEDFNYFHELVLTQEMARVGMRGFQDAFQGGMVIGLPPVVNFGNPDLQKEIIEPVLAGEKFIALAITEAFAGSDVQRLKCHAKKTEDEQFFIVNGTKKWITNGNFADYFSVGVNTEDGLSMLSIPRTEGVETRQLDTAYSKSAGTAFITFDNVKVPVSNLLGQEGMGVYVILSNFNHERWVMCVATARGIRAMVEETLKWANQRKAFGKRLIDQPVVRLKVAELITKAESAQAYLEHVTYQMCNMPKERMAIGLAGPMSILKAFLTRLSDQVSDQVTQLWGGRGLTKTGMGMYVEMYRRGQKFDAILGGSEEILLDLGARQATRGMPKYVL